VWALHSVSCEDHVSCLTKSLDGARTRTHKVMGAVECHMQSCCTHACSHDCSSIVFLTASTSTPEGWPRASTMIPTGASLFWAVVKGAIRAMHMMAVHKHQLDLAMVNLFFVTFLSFLICFWGKKSKLQARPMRPWLMHSVQCVSACAALQRCVVVVQLASSTTKNPRSGDSLCVR
jgi:hypothetical protein